MRTSFPCGKTDRYGLFNTILPVYNCDMINACITSALLYPYILVRIVLQV